MTGGIWLAGMPVYPLSFADRHVPTVPLVWTPPGAPQRETRRFAQLEAEYLRCRGAARSSHAFRIPTCPAESALADALRRGLSWFRLALPEPGSAYAARATHGHLKGFGTRSNGGLGGDGRPCGPDRGMLADTVPRARAGERGYHAVFRHPRNPPRPIRRRSTGPGTRRAGECPQGFSDADRDGDITRVFHEHHIDARRAWRAQTADPSAAGPGFRTGPLPPLKKRSRDATGMTHDLALHVLPDTAPPYAPVQSDAGVIVSATSRHRTGRDRSVERGVVPRRSTFHFPIFAYAGITACDGEPEFLRAHGPGSGNRIPVAVADHCRGRGMRHELPRRACSHGDVFTMVSGVACARTRRAPGPRAPARPA